MPEGPTLIDSASQPETRGIELIEDSARHGRARDLFFVWAAPNVSVLNFTIGATLILLGLEIWQAILVVIAGTVPWVFAGITAVSGPAAGTASSVITRAFYGIVGNRLYVALIGWLVSAVFLAVTWLASSFLGADLIAGLGLDQTANLVVVTVVVAVITVIIAVYGHAFITRISPYITVALLVIFILVSAYMLPQVDWSYRPVEPLSGVPLWSAISIGFTIFASNPLSYSVGADMARYLPRTTKRAHIVLATALGGGLPTIVFATVGVLFATCLTDAGLAQGIETVLLSALPAWLSPLLIIAVVVNAIALNSVTVYSSSMALQAMGLRINRVLAAVVVGASGTALAIYLVLSSGLMEAVNLTLQFLVIATGPTMSVYVTDVLMRRNQYDGLDLFDERRAARFWYSNGWGVPAWIALLVGGLTAALCLTTDVWSGPIAEALGYIDLSVPAGMAVTSVVYWALSRTSLGRSAFPLLSRTQ